MKKIIIKAALVLKKVFVILLCALIVCLTGTTIWNGIMCTRENEQLEHVGTEVKVNNTDIRVSVTGNGKKTIVLLSGMGTPSPITDFKPLAEILGKKYRVVTLEYAGYGLSQDSDEERNSKAIVEEIRGTLQQLQIKPPYILMPHSISGVYSLQYMKMYPKEVEAMVGIDSSVPNQTKYASNSGISKEYYYLLKFIDITGIKRLSQLLGTEFEKGMQASGNYSDKDLNIVNALSSRKSMTKAQFSENKCFVDNFRSLYDVKYPADIPVLFLLSDNSCKNSEELKEQGLDITWKSLHEEVISNPKIQKIVCLKGDHYLHWTQPEKIAELTEKFINYKLYKC